jgi:hypothetical protein
MFSFFRQSFKQWARSGTKPARALNRPRARSLQCEALEDRVLPSVMGSEILVYTTKTSKQHQAASATSENGSSVVVWTEVKGNVDRDVKAQRYDPSGNKVGGEITVATGFTPQHDAVVAMDAAGNFVIAWIHDFSTTDRDIRAARFNSAGVKQGSEFIVANTPRGEYDPSVAVADNSNFVISYTYQFNSTDSDIKAVLYNASGGVVKKFDVDASTRVEGRSSVSMAADGRFAVTYVKSDDIYLKRYTSAGNLAGTNAIANSTRQEREPSVAMDNNGNSVVVWQDNVNGNWNILGRTISWSGSASSNFTVQATSAQETNASVAVHPTNGKFVVAYQSQTTGNPSVKVTEMSASRTPIATSTALTNVIDPFISFGGSGNRFLAVAASMVSKGGDSDGGVFARWGVL